MKQEEFELIIKNDDTLNRLLNEKEISVFANFSNKNFENDDFKKYIEKAYKESYKEIFNKNKMQNRMTKKPNLMKNSVSSKTLAFNRQKQSQKGYSDYGTLRTIAK